MRSLHEFQEEFGRALRRPPGTAAPGFGIYVGNVAGNRVKALASAYPVCAKIVGEAFFDELARAYARGHAPDGGDLNAYGCQFPKFAAEHSVTRDLPYLPDVARMEWAAHRAHFADDSVPFDPARLADVRPEQQARLALKLSANASLMVSQWPLGRLWAIHQDAYAGEFSVDFETGFDRILIWRPRWRAMVASVAPGDYRLLAEAGRGAALGDALAATADAVPAFDAAAALVRWVSRGAIRL